VLNQVYYIRLSTTSNIIYLIDYGLCRKYRDKNNQHISYKENRNLTGTARYVSINTHLGIEQSRRDDLESIGYVIVFFMKGTLPWQGIKGIGDKFTKIMEKKLQIPTEVLCKGLPDEISTYLNYCKGLRFEDKPDYEFLKGLFSRLLNSYIESSILHRDLLKFDWTFNEKNYLYNIFEKKNSKLGQLLKKENKKDNNHSAKSSPTTRFKEESTLTPITPMNDFGERNSDYNIFNELAKDINTLKLKLKNDDSFNTPSDDSSATEKKDIQHEKVEFLLSEDGRSGEVEEIDHVINKIKRTTKKGKPGDISDDTIEVRPNADKLDLYKNTINAFDSESDKSDNSFINFVNLKKNKTQQEHETKHDELFETKHSRKFLPLKTFKEESNYEN